MMSIEPSSGNQGDKPLSAIGIGAVVGHWDPTRWTMAQNEVFIDEFISVDTFAYNKKR